jgi:general secretion pathway protein A
VGTGGFATIEGPPGGGKSVALRLVADRLSRMRDVVVGEITRPQSRLSDFYRELASIFGIVVSSSNRWGGYKMLREKWLMHIESTLMRPVLLIDEAQEVPPIVLDELRLLGSTRFDSCTIVTVVLSGDLRLAERLKTQELLPLDSRIRTRLSMSAGHQRRSSSTCSPTRSRPQEIRTS